MITTARWISSSKLIVFLCASLLWVGQATTAAPITVPTDLNPGDTYRLVFVTSSTRDATSSDTADYNDFVTGVANGVTELAALGTTWTAIASTDTVDARDNTATNPTVSTGVPIYRLDDVRIADNYSDLWDGSIDAQLETSESGAPLAVAVWTGSRHNGTGATQPLGTISSIAGFSSRPDADWVDSTTLPGPNSYTFYAISGELTVVPEPSSLALAVFGAMGLLLFAQRKRGGIGRFLLYKPHQRTFLSTALALVCIGASPGVAGVIVLDPYCSDGNAGNGIEGVLLDPNYGCVAGDPAITAADYPDASLFSPAPLTVPLGQDLVLDLTSLPSDFGLDIDFFLTHIGIAAPLGNFVADAGREGPGALTVSSSALANIGITSTGTFDVHFLVTDLDSNNLGNQLGDISQFTLTIVDPVPEPSSLALAGIGLAGSLLLFRRRMH